MSPVSGPSGSSQAANTNAEPEEEYYCELCEDNYGNPKKFGSAGALAQHIDGRHHRKAMQALEKKKEAERKAAR